MSVKKPIEIQDWNEIQRRDETDLVISNLLQANRSKENGKRILQEIFG